MLSAIELGVLTNDGLFIVELILSALLLPNDMNSLNTVGAGQHLFESRTSDLSQVASLVPDSSNSTANFASA